MKISVDDFVTVISMVKQPTTRSRITEISFTGIAIVVVVGAVAVVASGAAVDGDAVDTAAVAGGEEMIA